VRQLARLEELAAALVQRDPSMRPHVNLVTGCLSRYPEVLTGELPATDVLFPGGSMALVEGVYKGYAIADYFNQLMATAARCAAVRSWEHGRRKLRVLEIGAGTGGTSAHVLPALARAGGEVEYFYTDISLGFTQHGRHTYGKVHSFTRFQVLDIERDVAAQGFEPESFDVVLATNVLHATRRLARTLGGVRTLLRPGGLLLLNEMTAARDFATLTFGLLDGWWLFEDGEVRLPHGPIVGADGWRRLLEQQGLRVVGLHGEPGRTEPSEFHQSVVVAERLSGAATQEVRAPTARPAAPARPPPPPVQEPTPLPVPAPSTRPAPEPPRVDGGKVLSFVEEKVAGIVAEVLEMKREQVEQGKVISFADLGVDSVISAELIRKINEALQLSLKTTVIFAHPGIQALASFITAEHGAELGQRFGLVSGHEAVAMSAAGIGQSVRLQPFHGDGGAAEAPLPGAGAVQGGAAIDLGDVMRRLERGEISLDDAMRLVPEL